MIVSLIAAIAENRVIGKNNDLPWNLPDDMKYFMQTTKGHCVIMGRKNYESIPEKFRPLPNRTNMIVTRQLTFPAPAHIVHSVEEGIELAASLNETEVFIIGGAEIYALGLPGAQRLYLTEIHATIPGDTYFPAIHFSEWKEISRKSHAADDRHAHPFDFVVYERR